MLLSPRQRKLLARHAPPSVSADDLMVFGPIEVRCHSVKLLDHGLTVEQWRYPEGSDLLELSIRCRVGRAAAVATRLPAALRAYGVVPVDRQHTKTEAALLT